MNIVISKNKSATKPTNAAAYQKKQNYDFYNDISIDTAARLIGNGHAWRAGLYKEGIGTFKKSEVIGSQIIALDFDSCEVEPQTIINYAETIGLLPNFWYYSYSQGIKPLNNFRIVWCLESQISPKTYEEVYAVMLDTFKEFNPDESTKDCSRLWYGGNSGATIISVKPIKHSSLGWQLISKKAEEGIQIRKAINGKKGCLPEYAELDIPDAVEVLESEPWWEMLRRRCPLWDMYERGEYLNYNQRLTLFTNLKFIKYNNNNCSVFKDIMRFYIPDVWKGHSFDEKQLLSMLSDKTLRPIPIVRADGIQVIKDNKNLYRGSSYDIKSNHTKNEDTKNLYKNYLTVPEYLKQSGGTLLNPTPKVTLEELDAWMDVNVPEILSTPGMTYLKSQTGSGKTERILRYLAQLNLYEKKVIYAAPTHAGLREFEERFKALSDLPIYRLPEQNLSAVDVLYLQLGLPKKTRAKDRKQFIEQMTAARNGLFIITHALLVNMAEVKADLIIIDENIEDALLRQSKIALYQLGSIIPHLSRSNTEKLIDFFDEVKSMKVGENIKLDIMREIAPEFREHLDEYITGVGKDLRLIPSGFFNCLNNDGKTSTMSNLPCVRILQKSPLITFAKENNIPIKLFSATPFKNRLEAYYGVEIEYIEAPLAENKGRIIQYTGKTGAKGLNFSKGKDLADYIKQCLPQEIIDNSYLVSFKDTGADWKEWGFKVAEIDDSGEQLHFLNNAGLDCLKGKTLIVAGKFDKPQEYYADIWADLGDGTEMKQQNCVVEINGFKQNLYLYDKEVIKREQLANINYAIEQTAGRARALREAGAIVYLFSNYVIGDVDEVKTRL